MRQAIITRYIGPSNTKGSRISAQGGDHGRLVAEYAPALSSEENHKGTALALARKLGLMPPDGYLVGGWTLTGYVWIICEPDGKD